MPNHNLTGSSNMSKGQITAGINQVIITCFYKRILKKSQFPINRTDQY